MSAEMIHPLASIEPRLRPLLPADVYASTWVDPSPTTLMGVFEHLRTLQQIMRDYVPRHLLESVPTPGKVRFKWQAGTLMFTDLAGYTPLMEASAAKGREGAATLLGLLNSYFAEMIEIVSKSGGNLLEFTGDAILVEFPPEPAQAVRAGLRMQRAMTRFENIETEMGTFNFGMRVGVHTGRYLTGDIGTPQRMESVLLGNAVQETKRAEGAGVVGRICLTKAVYKEVEKDFTFEEGAPGYMLVVDDLSDTQLGEYELAAPSGRRLSSAVLFDRSIEGLTSEIDSALGHLEPFAPFVPAPILKVLVESASQREIPPDFPEPTVVFVNLIGPPEAVDSAEGDEERSVVESFSRAFALINAAVDARGGVLKKVTYHLAGSDIMIFFGVPNSHTDDPVRAADAALAIREIINNLEPISVGSDEVRAECQIGMATGRAFAAEIGEPRGRREFNVIGDVVNTSARLMGRAINNRILMTEDVYERIKDDFEVKSLGPTRFKGKAKPVSIYSLVGYPGENGDQSDTEETRENDSR